MSILPRIEIKLDEFGHGTITVNGEPLAGVTGFTVQYDAGRPVRINIELAAEALSMDANAAIAVEIRQAFQEMARR